MGLAIGKWSFLIVKPFLLLKVKTKKMKMFFFSSVH